MEISEKINKGWIQANLLFEILGRPKEHIIEVLDGLLIQLSKEKDVEVIKKKIYDPKEQKDLFSSYAEVEVITRTLQKLIEIIFDYMPSSIEITAPDNIPFKPCDANSVLNDLATRLHQYDMGVRALKTQRDILDAQLKDLKKKD